MNSPIRKSLSAPSLIQLIYQQFLKIPDPRTFKKEAQISLPNHLMSGLAIFSLKFSSLLEFDRKRKDSAIEKNLKTLFHVENAPSDTYLRERLDEVDPNHFRSIFKKIFSAAQRGKALENFKFMGEYYLLSIDGTGEFSSSKISCKNCCKKVHKGGQVSYYHQMLGACIVHPKQSNVTPLCPEIIQNQDGFTKNDCERNASKRFIKNFKREHPHLKVIVIEDGLASNGPHIKLLKDNNLKFILSAKPGDHRHLFDELNNSESTKYHEVMGDDDCFHQFRFLNNVALNKSHPNLKVNFFEYRQTNSKGKELNFSWVTNITISTDNVYLLMRGGRARWKIENETYNTLKNLGYNFEHNYGHGKQYLATIFCLLMMLAFLVDQIQEICCKLFQAVKDYAGTYRGLWNRMRVLFEYSYVDSWENFYHVIAKIETLNSS